MYRCFKDLFGGIDLISADSIKARLKNQALGNGRIFQEVVTAYVLERTIYRISISKYTDKFTLKGGIFLYALFDGNFARATTDIDLLAGAISNEIDTIKAIFEEIFSIQVDDAINYDLNSLEVQLITEFKEYHGVNVSVFAYLDRSRIPVSIDIGFGDIVHPDRVLTDFPVLLDMDVPKIYAYSLASVVAEKFEAIVSLGYANSRYKDFYDIYILLNNFDFNGRELCEAIKKTFLHRKTEFEDIVAFEESFAENLVRKTRWNAFAKKKRAMILVEFVDVLSSIKIFLQPVINVIVDDMKLDKQWDFEKKTWR